MVADDGVGDPQPVQVAHHALQPLSIGIIGEDHTCILHELGWREKGTGLSCSFSAPTPAGLPLSPPAQEPAGEASALPQEAMFPAVHPVYAGPCDEQTCQGGFSIVTQQPQLLLPSCNSVIKWLQLTVCNGYLCTHM